MGPMRTLTAAVAALVLAGCGATTPGTSDAPPSPSVPLGTGGIGFEALEATPASRNDASVEAAFDAQSASSLLDDVSAVDFDRQGVLCLYLGERTGRWGFAINALTLEDGALHIAAAERPPRAGDTSVSHPAQCVAVDRASLPAGDLKVSADDTVSDEFIVEGTIAVPAADSAP